MLTSSTTTTTPVGSRRFGVKIGSSFSPAPPPETLPGAAAGDPLEPLDHFVDLPHRGGEDRVGAAHRGDQPGAREQVGDVVLAEVDEAEAEGQRVAPADRPLRRARFGQRGGGGYR